MLHRFTLLTAAVLLAEMPAVQAQDVSRSEINELARDLSRVESIRAVKDLHRFYAQYAQFGLYDEMAALFAQDGEIIWGDDTIRGGQAITTWLKERVGGTRGLSPRALHTEFIEDPLINLSPDGKSAKVRWNGMAMTGDGLGGTVIEGGIYENEYVLENGTWVISLQRYFPNYQGNYEEGWWNRGNEMLPQVPHHFTIDESGIPIPDPVGAAPASDATLESLETRLAALNTEDSVRNLQNTYGYYVDRKMWDDVVDLFSEDGVVEIAGVGTFTGIEGVREAMERMGAQGLQQGQFNDHPSFGTIVTMLPGNTEAYTRGIALGMVGESSENRASWEFQVFRNRFVLEQGLWKIKELRIYPLLQAKYEDGWGSGGVRRLDHGIMPAFTEPHPVTGENVTIDGFTLAGTEPLTGPASPAPAVTRNSSDVARLLNAERRLSRSWAYDGVVNVSSAYGYYLDDFRWLALGSIFAKEGNKHSPFAGFYLGQDRIQAAATTMYGDPPKLRQGISFHWRFQPVIHVSYDGRSANLRTRLFQPGTRLKRDPDAEGGGGAFGNLFPSGAGNGSIFSGMYPNDQAVLEDGIWRLWSLTIDEPYMVMAGWKGGWHGVEPVPPSQAAGQSPLVERLPPDILMTDLGRRAEHFRGGTGVTYAWPDILPMWFHYKNPVSGRVPELYWPDGVPGLGLPEARLTSHGYQMPPNGPEQDGIHIELTPPENNVMEGGE